MGEKVRESESFREFHPSSGSKPYGLGLPMGVGARGTRGTLKGVLQSVRDTFLVVVILQNLLGGCPTACLHEAHVTHT